MNTKLLLQKLNEFFPLSTMGKGFTSTHSITLINDKLNLNVWWEGQSWVAKLDAEEESKLNSSGEEYVTELLSQLKSEIENSIKK